MEPNSSGCEIVRLPAPTCHYIEMHTPILSGWMTGPVITLIHTHTLVKGGGADELKDGRQKGENRDCKVNGLLRS